MRIADSQKYSTEHLLIVQTPRTSVLWAFSVNMLSINAPSAVREVPPCLHVGYNLKL